MTWKGLARRRVTLGFVFAIAVFWLARPTGESIAVGGAIAWIGELLRIWAAGHIEKDKEITRSGPYRLTRHPLYLGSMIMGAGFAVATRSWIGALIVVLYLAVTTVAAVRTEEASLDARFQGEYSAYRDGRAAPVARAFSVRRVWSNREYRAMIGLAAALGLLWLRAQW